VQRLSFGDGSFDVCSNTEVFEHVPDDLRGFREIRRVLAPGGVLLFTVPLHDAERTVERARMENGVLIHLLPPEYHEDNIRGRNNVLVYRDYGRDIVERLRTAGFRESRIVPVRDPSGMGHTPSVVVARKR
jgi:SAM-dependent methyltransferase